MKSLLNKFYSLAWIILFTQMVLVNLAIAQSAYSHLAYKQTIDTMKAPAPPDLNNVYMAKARTNTILGYIALSSGTTMVIIGALKNHYADMARRYTSRSDDGVLLMALGSVTAISSKIFFQAAGHNRMNATMGLQPEKISMGNSAIYKSDYMALSLKISF